MVSTSALAKSSADLGPTPLRFRTSEWRVVSAAMARPPWSKCGRLGPVHRPCRILDQRRQMVKPTAQSLSGEHPGTLEGSERACARLPHVLDSGSVLEIAEEKHVQEV